ncbi:30S ribosomal protein S4e [Halococcoides cellulosivorans]|uniref:Small ribosomal subunit protein eS4 n=1 Tax=Halococcoides cellulosivorans TaxID=1679096 RepID=A0A2R4X299_9EURY|nr:30S ribosomal protein S4e [Halococcoides cellulosivorans]AWB27914.1 30S ribosomal protein S4e [Halococcoides cellulosivorans]
MSNHQKRLSVPNSWPVERKTETFTVAPEGPHGEAGVPLLIVLRDVLGYVDSRKEARYALEQDQVLINGDPEHDETRPVGMFDILAFRERDEYYRVFPGQGGRLALTAIDPDDAESKLGKITSKTEVSGGKIQLGLHDGETLVVEDQGYAPRDSIVVANDSEEILAHFEYEEGELVTAVDGQHAGEVGRIEEIQVTPGSGTNNVLVEQADGPGFETIEEYVVVIDENFTESDDEADADAEAEDADDAEEADADAEADEADAEAEADDGGADE